MKSSSVWRRLFIWLVTLLVPIALVLLAVRILLTPVFINLEYRLPNFPIDPYGFTQQERLHWAEIARQYLLNDAGIDFLSELEFENGSPLYNQRELRHMEDVKNVVQMSLAVLYGSAALLLISGILAWRVGLWEAYRLGLTRGGWLTLGLVGAVILFVLISFNIFFVGFHRVFFEGDTWIFRFSDTLIRLFPVRFWQDAFIVVGGVAIGGGIALAYTFRQKATHPQP